VPVPNLALTWRETDISVPINLGHSAIYLPKAIGIWNPQHLLDAFCVLAKNKNAKQILAFILQRLVLTCKGDVGILVENFKRYSTKKEPF
jgi:hypothetical protein